MPPSAIKGCVDTITDAGATGWAFSENDAPIVIEAWCQGKRIGRANPARARRDLGAIFPGIPSAGRSGFSLTFDPPDPGVDIRHINMVATPAQSAAEAPPTTLGNAHAVTESGITRCIGAAGAQDIPYSPFPREVLSAVQVLWPQHQTANFDDDSQVAIAEKIGLLLSMKGSCSISFLASYARFLRSVSSHFHFVRRHFPETNNSRDAAAKDFACKQNSPAELLSIAHHLYVLRSYGIAGDFAEFGCFKGYSSSMLSYACSLLGIRMHIFDSFCGLPQSASTYYAAGDFSGSLDEVGRNLRIFGAPDVVEFHPGFYSESLKTFDCPDLISLWMDVDLESSARDVTTVFHKVNPAGAVFSHECRADNFANGVVSAERAADSVIPPILDSYKQLKAEVRGRFLWGNTGAFWRSRRSCPVLANAVLQKLIAIAAAV
jgi:O-methyltransferase